MDIRDEIRLSNADLLPQSSLLPLITNFSDFQLACLGSFILHEYVFFLSGLPFIYLERAGWLSKYKIKEGLVADVNDKAPPVDVVKDKASDVVKEKLLFLRISVCSLCV
ncbi:hypothetical protein Tco_1194300 [Tanacetum coccineum]